MVRMVSVRGGGTVDDVDGVQRATRPSRRSVLTSAAWSVPVVIVAAATPALAASPDPALVITGPSPAGAPEFQTVTLSFTNLPGIPASDPDGPGELFFELCLPEGVGVTSVSSAPAGVWFVDPALPDYQPGGTFGWNLSAIAAGSLQVSIVLRNNTGAALGGSVEVDVYTESLGFATEDIAFEFGTNPVVFRTCSG